MPVIANPTISPTKTAEIVESLRLGVKKSIATQMKKKKPDLYEALREYYGVDPASTRTR